MRKLATLTALLLLALLLAPEPSAADPVVLTGYASAYAPDVMETVVRYRLDTGTWRNQPPRDWYESHGAIATNNCAQVGMMMTIIDPAGREYRVLVADCGGNDGGADWMTANGIIAELDWQLWQQLTAAHGRPLAVGLK